MKKKIFLLPIVLALLVGVVLLVVACDNTPELPAFPSVSHPKTGLAESDLTIEWLDSAGNPTAYEVRKPAAIVFHGQVAFNDHEGITLSAEDYYYINGGDGTLEYATTLPELSAYWRKMGYNIGVFHYENFVDYAETPEEILDKVYTRSAPYRDDSGNVVNRDLPELSLLDAFWQAWEETVDGLTAVPISGRRGMEVRLIGSGIGANIALAAADYSYVRNQVAGLNAALLPVRVTAINPVYSATAHEVESVFRTQEKYQTVTDALEQTVKHLEEDGVVLEFIEENPPAEPTDGYRQMIARGVHLTFTQTYSERFTPAYAAKNRAALDWYLLSVGGSDYSGLSSYNTGYENTRPMFDSISDYSNSMVRYSVSAWTPTAYIRALKGLKMTMRKRQYNSSTGTQDYAPYELTKLAAENYQVSNLSQVIVAGYAYVEDEEYTAYINYGERMEGVPIRLTIYQSSQSYTIKEYYTTTGKDGFFSIAIDPQYYASGKSYSFYLEAVSPSSQYGLVSRTATGADYNRLEMGTMSVGSNQITISVAGSNSQIIVRNVGIRRY